MMGKRISGFLQRASLVILVLISSTFLFLSIVGEHYHSQVFDMTGLAGELSLTLALSLILLLAFVAIYLLTERLGSRGLYVVATILFASIGLTLAFILANFRAIPTTDSWVMIDAARYLASNPEKIIDGSSPYAIYFGAYSNNYFLTIVFMHLYRLFDTFGIQDQLMPLYIINSAAILLAVLLTFLFVKEVRGLRPAVRVLALLALNPLTCAFVTWVYSMTMSMPLMMGTIYCGMRAYRSASRGRSLLFAAAAGVLGCLSYYVRPTSCIPLVAFGLLAFLVVLDRPKTIGKASVLASVCLAIMLVLSLSIPRIFSGYFAPEVQDRNFPIEHWLMMGSHDDGVVNKPDQAFMWQFDSYEERKASAGEAALENYRSLGVSGTMQLFFRKNTFTFCDGFSDLGGRMNECVRFPVLYDYIAGYRNGPLRIYCQAFRIATYLLMLLAAVRLLRKGGEGIFELLCPFVFMGGAVFYCIWEAKNVYSVPFVPVMLVTAELGLQSLGSAARKEMGRIGNGQYVAGCTYALLGLALLSVAFYYPFCKQDYARERFRARTLNTFFSHAIDGLKEPGNEVLQGISGNDVFNRVEIRADSSGNGDSLAVYVVDLLDENDAVLYSTALTANDIEGSWLTFDITSEVATDRCTNLRIRLQDDGERRIDFLLRSTLALDRLPGHLVVDGIEQNNDLGITLYQLEYTPLMGKRLYLALAGLSMGSFLVLCVAVRKLAGTSSDAMPKGSSPVAVQP